jgi:phosphatidyl-myo-inositol alpha-mannosyltransferase
MPLRIAVVSQAYHPAIGGVTEHVDATTRVLRERGHAVTVITARYPRAVDGERDVVRLGRNVVVPFNGAENNITIGRALARKLAGALEEGRFDVVHVHCPLSPTLPIHALRVARVPVVGTFHSTARFDISFRLFRAILMPLYRRIDRPLAVSVPAREYIARQFPGPVEVVPNGVDVERFRPGLPRLERFDDGVPNILFVGRHDPRKGLPDLMEAAQILAREGLDFRLIIVGDGWLRGRAEGMSRGALRGRVHFEGRVSNVNLPRYYASADVFCSPARGGESFGMVLLEAMASGVPVVASDIPGYRSVLTPGLEGIAPPPRDPRALATALRALLVDPEARRRMGLAGLSTSRRYAWPGIVTRLEEIYRALAGGTEGASPGREDAADARRRGAGELLSTGS